MKTKRWLSLALALLLVFSLAPGVFAAAPAQTGRLLPDGLQSARVHTLLQRQDEQRPGDQVRAIVLTESEPTAARTPEAPRLASGSEAALMAEHTAVKQRMEQQGIACTVNFEYTALLNGMSVTVDRADLDALRALPGVTDVVIAREYRVPEPQPAAATAAEMINAAWLNDTISADGSGKVIAVLDTGITVGHEAFGVYSGMLQTPAYTKSDMLKAILKLGHGAYGSQKIPYQYDYADKDQNAADDNSGHGSHVAGIAAGYVATSEGEITFRGSAPDAQILAMKVFSSQQDTTSSDIYIAALEDAYKLGADVINMSLGAPCGFVEDSESVLNDRIYERLEAAGIVCCMSAGNEASLAENAQNQAGPGTLTTGNIDYGMLGSPASYTGNLAIASAENREYPAYQITVGGRQYSYLDSDGTAFLDKFAGQDPAYVMVPNFGAAEDYAGLDVSGKVAVVQRGEITFEEKVAFAADAGASAAVIYDNRAGELISMAVDTKTIPAVFVSQETGAALAASAEKTFHVDAEATVVQNPNAELISSFSSWGPTNTLEIKPSITAVGGNVNSALAGTSSSYVVQSGTSMSAPNAAGGYAALLDALGAANPGLTKAQTAALARSRTLSSARILTDGASVPFSPRRQGAGLLDLAAAYKSVLAVDDPLAELGDDPAKSGVYTVTADVQNTSGETRTYTVSADVLTDSVDAVGGKYYNVLEPKLLRPGTDYTLTAPKTVTLAPGERKTVSAKIKLSSALKTRYLDARFENGAFVEGYLRFESADEQAHVTFLAFYGDWSAAPIVQTHDWRELMDLSPEEMEDWASHVDWEIDTIPGEAYLADSQTQPMFYAGGGLFGYPENGSFSDARIAVSNGSAAYCSQLVVVPSLCRNARHVVMIARDAETGAIYASEDLEYRPKTIYSAQAGWTASAWFAFDGKDTHSGSRAVPLANNTKVVIELYANLPYGEDALGGKTPEQIAASCAQYLAYSVPCVVDSEAPVIEQWEYDYEAGTVTATVKDNQYLSGVYAVDKDGKELADPVPFADTKPGQRHTVTLQVGQQNDFYLCAADYATNEASLLAVRPIVIHQQPQDAFARRGETVKFTVEASGVGLSYQWQYRTANSSSWKSVLSLDARTSSISVTASALNNGNQYRCVLKDSNGQSVTTDAAALNIVTAPQITAQPENVTVTAGSEAQFRVVAEGGGLSYQWQYSADNGATWNSSKSATGKTDTLTFKTSTAYNGRLYRCVVTNAAGTAVSSTAKLLVTTNGPVITVQPQNVTAQDGGSARFAVKAKGTGLTYRWQYSADNGATWKNSTASGSSKAAMSITAKLSFNGRLYRCVVTDSSGRTAVSSPAKLTVKSGGPVITVQPKPTSAAAGGSARFSVTARGEGLTYQWQYSRDNGETWTNSTASGTANATIYITVKASFNNRLYRCVVTDANGKTAVSEAVRLTVQ